VAFRTAPEIGGNVQDSSPLSASDIHDEILVARVQTNLAVLYLHRVLKHASRMTPQSSKRTWRGDRNGLAIFQSSNALVIQVQPLPHSGWQSQRLDQIVRPVDVICGHVLVSRICRVRNRSMRFIAYSLAIFTPQIFQALANPNVRNQLDRDLQSAFAGVRFCPLWVGM
jgi:hypothetical protein